VVVPDDDGVEVLFGKPPVRTIRTHRFGGIWDTRINDWVGPSREPQLWYVSEAQEQLILHADDLPSRLLVLSAMGAGKSAVLAMWLIVRALGFAGLFGCVGVTAPTVKRLNTVLMELESRMPETWYTHHVHKGEIRMNCGITLQMVSTNERSAAIGSGIQGQNWLACGSDEIQDSIAADGDIEARGRSAIGGVYKRLCTATAKQSSDWRTYRDLKKNSPLWEIIRFPGRTNWTIWPRFWEEQKIALTDRQYRRQVLAEDLPSELAIYGDWSRDLNTYHVPRIGAQDVTAQVLAPWGGNCTVLAGHDPGEIKDVTVLLKAYRLQHMGANEWAWVIVGELTTSGTTELHIAELLKLMRNEFGCNELDYRGRPIQDGAELLVRIDPKAEKTVNTQFRRAGLNSRAAAYTNTNPPRAMQIPKEAGIDMVNTLIRNAAGKRHLFAEVTDDGRLVAGKTVEAIESSERDAVGRAEIKQKNRVDHSHYTAALRYALWVIERPRMERLRSIA